jgi:argininosuccinate lyase
VLKGLPLAYNKDLQETQEPLYDAVETTTACVRVMTGLCEGLELDTRRMRAACDAGFLCATEVADWLTARGVPFRRAHDVVGALVRRAIERGLDLAGLSLDDYQAVAPEFDQSVYEVLDPLRAVERRHVVGGPAKAAVLRELDRVEKELDHAPL